MSKEKGIEKSLEKTAEKISDVMFTPYDGKKLKKKIGEKIIEVVDNTLDVDSKPKDKK